MAGVAVLELGDLLLERAAGGVLDAGVLVLRRFAQPALHVGGGLIDGHRDGAGARIRRLAGMDGAGGKAEVSWIAFQVHIPRFTMMFREKYGRCCRAATDGG